MTSIKGFSDFSEALNESHPYYGSSQEMDGFRNIIKDLISETNNKVDEKKVAEVTEKILKEVFKSDVSRFFKFFNNYGIGSLILLSMYTHLFRNYGFIKSNLNPEACSNLLASSENFLEEQSDIAEKFSSLDNLPKIFKKSPHLAKHIPTEEKINNAKENVSNGENILKSIKDLISLVDAINSDNVSTLSQEEKDLLIDLGLDFTDDYSNSSKLKQQSPKIYDLISDHSATGGDKAVLGDLGF